jgi:hypothetical protein
MKRGTTPTHTFTLPFEMSGIKKFRITYAQNGKVVFYKTDADITIENDTISVKLTQEDTLALDCHKGVEIQVKLLTSGGDTMVSDIIRETVDRCLDSEVLK